MIFGILFNRISEASIRTTNGAQVHHRRIGSVMQCAHSTLWIFLQKFIDEIHVNALQIQSGQPQGEKQNQTFE